MGQRGRTSKAAKQTAETAASAGTEQAPAAAGQRLAPPDHLTKTEAGIWSQVVDRMPVDWFPAETHEMLAQYCRHAVNARRFANALNRYRDQDPEEQDRDDIEWLLKQHDREGRAMTNLATKMRLTQQSTYSEKHTKPPAGPKPWES